MSERLHCAYCGQKFWTWQAVEGHERSVHDPADAVREIMTAAGWPFGRKGQLVNKLLCIYHGGCDDGFAAAWCVRRRLGSENVEFYPGVYQRDPPDVTGRDVLMVDFSYKRSVIEAMAVKANSVLILDHHHTAAQDLFAIGAPPSFSTWREAAWNGHLSQSIRMTALFDMQRSGAGLAWDYFFDDEERPDFINYIEDRDLWRKKLEGGDKFTIALRSYLQDFEVWDLLIKDGPHALIAEGKSIQRYYRLRVEELKRSAYPAMLGGAPCWIANAPYFAASEVAGELAEKTGFGACYFEVAAGRWGYSLRSRAGFDCSAVALKFGGGGHKAAAGFTTDTLVHVRD